MTSVVELGDRLANLYGQIRDAALRCDRDPQQILFLAATKTVCAERVLEVIEHGQFCFGENYVQEAKTKIEQIENRSTFRVNRSTVAIHQPLTEPVFHGIGHLQRNKARDAVALFDVIQSVDSPRIAEAIAHAAECIGKRQKILLEVNTSGESSKSGVEMAEAEDLLKEVLRYSNLECLGLMTIGEYVPEHAPREMRVCDFKKLRNLREQLQDRCGISLPELSMGMSHDFSLAIEEGATIVRLGTALFGKRDT